MLKNQKRLFAGAVRKIRTYLLEPLGQKRTYLPEQSQQIKTYLPEPVLANMILLARTVLIHKNMSVHQCPLVVVCVCT